MGDRRRSTEPARVGEPRIESLDEASALLPERIVRKCGTCNLAGGRAREQIARWIDDAVKRGIAITAPRLHQLLEDWCRRHELPMPAERKTFVRHIYECERERWRALKAL